MSGAVSVAGVGRNLEHASYSTTGDYIEIAAPGGNFAQGGPRPASCSRRSTTTSCSRSSRAPPATWRRASTSSASSSFRGRRWRRRTCRAWRRCCTSKGSRARRDRGRDREVCRRQGRGGPRQRVRPRSDRRAKHAAGVGAGAMTRACSFSLSRSWCRSRVGPQRRCRLPVRCSTDGPRLPCGCSAMRASTTCRPPQLQCDIWPQQRAPLWRRWGSRVASGLVLPGRRLAVQGSRRTRLRLENQTFRLGIPLTVTIVPVEVSGGYRFRGREPARSLRRWRHQQPQLQGDVVVLRPARRTSANASPVIRSSAAPSSGCTGCSLSPAKCSTRRFPMPLGWVACRRNSTKADLGGVIVRARVLSAVNGAGWSNE